jgi:hypothetical protein
MSTTIIKKAKSKTDRVTRAQQLVAGAQKHFPNGAQELSFGSSTRTVTALTQLLQSIVDLREAVITSQSTARARVDAENAQLPALLAVSSEFETFVRSTFAKQPEVLADFGLAPRKARKPLTTEQLTAAAAKRKATRDARRVMGTQQRKAVKGDVTGVVVTPVTSPATPQAPGAPPSKTPDATPAAVPPVSPAR